MAPTIRFSPAEIACFYGARVPRLSQRGRQWRGVCPLHAGKRFSFSVNPETGCWYCFADCGRGGSLLDLEMALTASDFRTALAGVFGLIGRPVPEPTQLTQSEWRAIQTARERERQEQVEASFFAAAAMVTAEGVLEGLEVCDQERAIYTALIARLLCDPGSVYREWRLNHPDMAAALMAAGRRSELRIQTRLLRFIEVMAREESQHAA